MGTGTGDGTHGWERCSCRCPKMREGGYVPSFIEHRKRSEQALISVIQEAVVKGVSTRKIEAVLEEFGIAGVSAGQVSQLCTALDEKVRQVPRRRAGRVRYVWVDALYEKVRVDDRVEVDGSGDRHRRESGRTA